MQLSLRRSCLKCQLLSLFFNFFSPPRWKKCRPLSADGNYRPLSKARQQQNISMRRQENLRWMSELSYVEEKERWQEQINQLKKQHEFSVSICQTLMQDQQVDTKSSYFAVHTLLFILPPLCSNKFWFWQFGHCHVFSFRRPSLVFYRLCLQVLTI